MNSNRPNLVPAALLRAAAFSLAALAIACLRPACVLAGTASEFQTVFAGPVSGPAYPAPAVKTGLLNLNSFPPNPVYQRNEMVSLAVLNAWPPGPIAPPIATALTTHVDAAAQTVSSFDLFYPPTPIMPAGTFLLSYQAINPRNQANLPMALLGLENVTSTGFDLRFSADVPEEIQGDLAPNSPAGMEAHALHVTATQGLTFSNVQAPALGNFTFDFSGGTVDPNTPILTATLSGDFTAVPEPSVFTIVGLGFGVLMICRRYRGRAFVSAALPCLVTALTVIGSTAHLQAASRLFVANFQSNTVGAYDAATGATVSTPFVTTSGGGNHFLALDGNNHLFVSNANQNTVGEYNATTGATINATFITNAQGLNVPGPMVVDSSNHLFVASGGVPGGTVGEYDLASGATINSAFINVNQGLATAAAVAIDKSNNHMFVADGNDVREFDATTGATVSFGFAHLGGPSSFALDGLNHLFVASPDAGSVLEYDSITGATLNANFITGLNGPHGLALDDNNHIFVTNDVSNIVGEYNATTGAALNAAFINGQGLNIPGPIAFGTTVPEPPACLGVGFGFVIVAAVRRQRTRTVLTIPAS